MQHTIRQDLNPQAITILTVTANKPSSILVIRKYNYNKVPGTLSNIRHLGLNPDLSSSPIFPHHISPSCLKASTLHKINAQRQTPQGRLIIRYSQRIASERGLKAQEKYIEAERSHAAKRGSETPQQHLV